MTKSGTNALRGQVYEWYRGSTLDARNYFDRRPGGRNATTGQPVRRRRRRAASERTGPSTLPTSRRTRSKSHRQHRHRANGADAQRRLLGFARARAAGSDLQPVHEPAVSHAGRNFTRDPFPGNIIPRGMYQPGGEEDPQVPPAPQPDRHGGRQQNYQNPTAVAYKTYYTATGRVNHNLSDQQRMYGRFSWDFWEEEKDDRFDDLATGIFLNRKNRVLGAGRRLHAPEQPADRRPRRVSRGRCSPSGAVARASISRGWASRRQLVSLAPRRHGRLPASSTTTAFRTSACRNPATGQLHDRCLFGDRVAHVARRRPQHEVRFGVPELHRGASRFSDSGRAAGSISATPKRAGRSTIPPPRRSERTSPRSCSGCPRAGAMSRAGVYTEKSSVLSGVLRSRRLACAEGPDAEPRCPLGDRTAADRSARDRVRQRVRPDAAADRRRRPGQLRPQADCRDPADQFGVPADSSTPIRAAGQAWSAISGTSCRAPGSRGCLAEDLRARRLRAVL